MAFVAKTLLMMKLSFWLSRYGSWRLTATFMRGVCRRWFSSGEECIQTGGEYVEK
jgi:hypothetical protein